MEKHPTSEALAAFVAGNLYGDELKEVSEHVLVCRRCLDETRQGARHEREEEDSNGD